MYVIFAPLLIALAAGAFLFAWSERKESGFGKLVGGVVTFFAIVLLLLQCWQMSKIWQNGLMMKKEMQKMMSQMPDNTDQKK